MKALIPGRFETFFVVINAVNDFCIGEMRILIVDLFDVQRHQRSHPSVTVNHIRLPTQFLNGLQNPAAEKHTSFIIVCEISTFVVCYIGFAFKELIVIDKINLKTSRRNRCYLDD
ncbi:hypothetical protein D3C80_1279940 [compost metagenome]